MTTHPPTDQHNYLPKVFAVGMNHVEKGTVRDVEITHDDWCDALRSGFCNCNPDVRLRPIGKE